MFDFRPNQPRLPQLSPQFPFNLEVQDNLNPVREVQEILLSAEMHRLMLFSKQRMDLHMFSKVWINYILLIFSVKKLYWTPPSYFLGQNYWKLTDTSVADGYPRLISQDWAGLPDNLDAAFTWDSGATYFFKGGEYWKFENMVPSSNYPKPLSKGFPDIPSDIDAAFVWGGNGKIYFFKDNNYWKFDPDRTPHVQSGKYPRSLSLWGLPSNVEGSIQWDNGKTYFFKKGQYWRFNDLRFGIDRGNPPFPRNTGEWWFGCPKVRPLIDGNAGVNLPGVNLPVVQAVEDGGDVAVRIDLLDEEYSNTAGNEDLDAF